MSNFEHRSLITTINKLSKFNWILNVKQDEQPVCRKAQLSKMQ